MFKYFSGDIDDAPLCFLPTDIDSNWFDDSESALQHAIAQSNEDYESFKCVIEYNDGNVRDVVAIAFDGDTFTRDQHHILEIL